jgi:RNA polymerase sigma-B factor
VLDALRVQMAARPLPLDDVDQGELALADASLREVEQRLDLGARLDRLDARSRRVVILRFGLELSQREIAERLGISQMHVSRLLRASLAELAEEGADG